MSTIAASGGLAAICTVLASVITMVTQRGKIRAEVDKSTVATASEVVAQVQEAYGAIIARQEIEMAAMRARIALLEQALRNANIPLPG